MSASQRILIVDDHASLRRNLAAMLVDAGYQVAEVSSGEEALELLRAVAFHLALVDVRLPGMTGPEFIEAAHVLCSGMRCLIHTGSAEFDLPEALIRLGYTEDDIHLKPVPDLEAVVRQTLGG